MIYSICPNCFREVDNYVCPVCSYDQNSAKQFDGVLPPETILNARYLLGRVLGKGGFGVTYLARDLVTQRNVAIKECLPEHYAYRADNDSIYEKQDNTVAFQQCKDNFLVEINALYSLNDNAFVVDVLDAFSENNTEYFVMEYIDGVSLKILTNSNAGMVSVSNAALVLFTIGSALIEVHKKGIIHRDISPENIMIDRKGDIKLIDFGAAKNYRDTGYYRNESIFLKPGFAPPEQYSLDGNQGPWTDVYALAATFYTAVSGQPLVDSIKRLECDTMKRLDELECGISEEVATIVQKALEPEIARRYASVGEFLDAMADNIAAVGAIDNEMLSVINDEKEQENRLGDNDSHTRGVPMPWVEIQSGIGAGISKRIPDYGFISIGRAEDNDILLNDFEDISRHHAMVGFDRVRKRFIIIDNSSNGTFFSNGRKMLSGAQSFVPPEDFFYICQNGIQVKVFLK